MLSRRSLQAGTTIALPRNVLPSSGNINGYLYSTKNKLQRTVICQGFDSRWSSSSTRWKSRQGKDFFTREARVQGLKSRAAFKLLAVGLLKWMMVLKLKRFLDWRKVQDIQERPDYCWFSPLTSPSSISTMLMLIGLCARKLVTSILKNVIVVMLSPNSLHRLRSNVRSLLVA